MVKVVIFLLATLFIGVLPLPFKPYAGDSPCLRCHDVDPNKLNVHLIPHSHDDVGWLKTVDQYYYGSHSDIQNAGVQYIISSMVEALKTNSDRRYMQVETAFLWMWFKHQDEATQQDFIDLVNNGQLEIVNAAWSMNDEAAANYHSTIDQFTWGLRLINDTIGECGRPKIGWQIDPFGHSREQASIFAQLGYEAVFFARLDHGDKDQRIKDKTMEVIWKASSNSDDRNIFTNIFPGFYNNPSGFCFDIECGDEVLNDDLDSPDYNVPRKVEEFANAMNDWAAYYRTKHLIIPMGGDFQYQSSEKNFANMDKLIAGFQDHDSINVIYSTPSCYLQAVNDAANADGVAFAVKEDDFFPYGSGPHNQWTGYFTSRPNAKRFERASNNLLQAAKQLASFEKVNGNDHEEHLTPLRQAMGILQHHDAITGTAKQAVAKDYTRLMTKGVNLAQIAIAEAENNLLAIQQPTNLNLDLKTCLLANVSICEQSQGETFVVTVYNPLSRAITDYIRVPVPDGDFTVTGSDGEVEATLVDSISDFSYVDVGVPQSPKELVFLAADVAPLGLKLFYVQRSAVSTAERVDYVLKKLLQPGVIEPNAKFGDDNTGFEIDDETGLLKSVTMNGVTVQIKQEFLYYSSFEGDNDGDDHISSGAYIFRPESNDATPITTEPVDVTSAQSDLVDEVHQKIGDYVTQIIRVYKGANPSYIEFDWLVGPIPIDDGKGREIITRFTVDDFNNDQTFFTDSNGREMIQRKINQRPDYTYDPENVEPVASNYYPITSKIVIKDQAQNLEVAVLNDRAQGGSSLTNGVIEVMVHRRTHNDDVKGVGEALSDEEFGQGVVARGQHYLIIGKATVDSGRSTAAMERDLALRKLLQPVVLFAETTASLTEVQNAVDFYFEGLAAPLPENVHILTLEPWKDDTFILRLEHPLERGEDPDLSVDVTVDLTAVFATLDVESIRETTLGGNDWLDEYENRNHLTWNTEDKKITTKLDPLSKADDLQITLFPTQIRTFIIQLAKKAV